MLAVLIDVAVLIASVMYVSRRAVPRELVLTYAVLGAVFVLSLVILWKA